MSEQLYGQASAAINRSANQQYKSQQQEKLVSERMRPFHELASSNRCLVNRALGVAKKYNGSVLTTLAPVIVTSSPSPYEGISVGAQIKPIFRREGSAFQGDRKARLIRYAIAGDQLSKTQSDPFFSAHDLAPIDETMLYGVWDQPDSDQQDELLHRASDLASGPFTRSLRNSLHREAVKSIQVGGAVLQAVEYGLSEQSGLNLTLTEMFGTL